MIVVAASVPATPLLLPGLSGAAALPELHALRSACQAAVASLRSAAAHRLVVLGSGPTTGPAADGSTDPRPLLAPHRGQPPAAGPPLPVPLAVGRHLLAGDGELLAVAGHASPAECAKLGTALAHDPRRTALLVVADGSARLGERAPGHVDARARPFDERVLAALAAADTDALAGLEPGLAADLLADGRAAWQVLAAACRGAGMHGRLLYADAPFGVCYPVALWEPARPDGGR